MTTDETCDQSGNTPEEIVHAAIWGKKLIETDMPVILANDAHAISTAAVGALRAARRLVEGAPTDEQIERAAVAICVAQGHAGDRECEHDYAAARAALAAAGVASPAPSVRMALLDEVIAAHEGQVSTHYEGCYRDHAGCLAMRIRESERAGEADAVPAQSEARCWCFDLPRGEHHADCEPEPAPTAERETLTTSLRRVAAVLEEYKFEDHASEAAGLMNSAADALAAPAPVEWEYAVQFKEAGGDWTQPNWTNLATAERIERWHGPADLESVMVRRRKAGAPEAVSGLDSLRGEKR